MARPSNTLQSWIRTFVRLLVLAALLLVLQESIRLYLAQLFRKELQAALPAGYTVDYDRAQIHWRQQQLHIQNFKLTTDSQRSGAETKVNLTLPDLRLQLRSILTSLRRNALLIDDIEVIRPHISLEKQQKRPSNFTQSSFQLLDSLSQYLDLLEISQFRMQDARLEHIIWQDSVAEHLQFDNIDLYISDFSLDSTWSRHSFLNARTVELEIHGQEWLLPQKDHSIRFDTLRLSTQARNLYFAGLTIQPLDSAYTIGDQISLYTPQLLLQNIDFEASYLKKELDIGALFIQSPQIQFSQGKQESSEKTDSPIKRTLNQLATQLQIDSIALLQADIDLNLRSNANTAVRFDIDSILIFDLAIDSSTSFQNLEAPPFRDIRFRLSDIRQYINREVGWLQIDQAQLNSADQEIELHHLSLGDSSLQQHSFYQEIPWIHLSGINIFDVFFGRQALMSQITIQAPVTRMKANKNGAVNRADQFFYQRIGAFFKDFFLKEIQTRKLLIQDGTLNIPEKLSVAQYQYQAQNIRLHSGAQSWTRVVPQFELLGTGMIFSPEEQLLLETDSLWIIDGEVQVRNAAYRQRDSVRELSVQIDEIQVQGLNMDSLFAKKFHADSLAIQEPHIFLRQFQASSDLATSFSIQVPIAIINRGQLYYESPTQDTLKLRDFDAIAAIQDSLDLRFSQFAELQLNPSGPDHQIRTGRGIQLPGGFSYELNNLEFIPRSGYAFQDSSWHIPNLRLSHWDIQTWQREKRLKIQKIILEQPSTQLRLGDSQAPSELKLDYQIDTLLIFNAHLGTYRSDRNAHLQLPSLTVAAYDLSSNTYRSLLLGLDQGLHYQGEAFQLQTAPLFYNSTLDNIRTDSIYYRSLDSNGIHQINLYKFVLSGLQPKELLNSKDWHFTQVKVDSAYLQVLPNQTPGNQAWSYPTNWPKVRTDQVLLQNISLVAGGPKNIIMEGGQVDISALQLDSSLAPRHLSRAYGTLATSVKKLSLTPDKNQYYRLELGAQYQSQNQQLRLNQIQLNRQLSTQAFTQQLEHRRDYWQVRADQLSIYDFAPEKLFAEHWRIPKIEVRQVVADDFNDETVPLPDAYKPLLPDQIKSLKQPFLVDTFSVADAAITYRAIAPLTGDSSWIRFNEIDAQIYHVTNIPKYFDQELRLEANALLYDHAPLAVNMQFQLDKVPSTFELSGELTELDLQRLNPILRGQAALAVTKGQSSRLLFNLAANDSVAVGELLLRYKKLRVQLLDKEDLSNRSSFLSFWTNRLIQSRNPNWLRRRKGIIFFRRDQHKAISHYWAHSILSGIVSSIGVKNTRRRLKKADLDVESFSYETLLKEQLKTGKDKQDQKDNL